MFLTLIRYSTTLESTLGVLLIDGYFACYILEPGPGKRIPGGIYALGLHTAGRLHSKYLKRFPKIHQGMILIKNVPGKQGIELHIGNWAAETSACLLTGDSPNNNQLAPAHLLDSTPAYLRIYPEIKDGIQGPEGAQILIGVPEELIKFEPFNQKTKEKNHV